MSDVNLISSNFFFYLTCFIINYNFIFIYLIGIKCLYKKNYFFIIIHKLNIKIDTHIVYWDLSIFEGDILRTNLMGIVNRRKDRPYICIMHKKFKTYYKFIR